MKDRDDFSEEFQIILKEPTSILIRKINENSELTKKDLNFLLEDLVVFYCDGETGTTYNLKKDKKSNKKLKRYRIIDERGKTSAVIDYNKKLNKQQLFVYINSSCKGRPISLSAYQHRGRIIEK